MTRLLVAFSSLLFLIAGLSTASAGEWSRTGTPAWSTRPLLVMEGPGINYEVVGEIGPQARIYVDRCSRQWCRVHAGHVAGWTNLYAIAFGGMPEGPIVVPRLHYKAGGGLVCLYEGRNFTGKSYCAYSGTEIQDLLLIRLDNVISSVTVEGNATVLLCRDRLYHSYCELMGGSEPRLQGFLDDNVSSVRVY